MTNIRARVPLRISFAGGGTDVPPYCDERGGAVLSATINLAAHASLTTTDKKTIHIHSADFDRIVEYSFEQQRNPDEQFGLAQLIVEHFRKVYFLDEKLVGLDIRLQCAAPPGSGLGSSSAIAVALVGCIAEFLNLSFDSYSIAELAYRIERVEAKIAGGKQDQFATTFGGFNFIEFKNSKTIVHPLRLSENIVNELEYRLVFAYIGGQRYSGGIIDRQIDNFEKRKSSAVAAMDALKYIAYEIRDALLIGKLQEFGELLHRAWEEKKKMATGISNERIDEIYSAARNAGAVGGKLSGAGGGGFMMFFCLPDARFSVQRALKDMGCQLVDLSFTGSGLSTWQI